MSLGRSRAAPIKNSSNNKAIFYFALLTAAAGLLAFVVTDTGRSSGAPTTEPMAQPMAETQSSSVVRYEALGDSITYGIPMAFRVDRLGHPRRAVTRFQGWPALLGQMLAAKTGTPIEIFNNGYPGDRVGEFRIERVPELIDAGDRSSRVLLLIGTNDSNDFHPTPSGRGCAAEACSNTYNGLMRSIIKSLEDAGRETIYVATLPPVWGSRLDSPYADPLDLSAASRNARIVEFNEVIVRELLALPGVKSGPDFFSCFLTPTVNRFSLFRDTLHPNALGYVFMAALWRDTLTGVPAAAPLEACPAPIYILESLDPYAHGHKQDLLEVGDTYYTDESFVLDLVPGELANGIWVTQANSDRNNRDENFLTFDVGQTPVSVYIAHDPGGIPPRSSSHEFRPVTLSADLRVSDPKVGALSLVGAVGVTGTVSIGGNRSGHGAPPQQSYVVVVVP